MRSVQNNRCKICETTFKSSKSAYYCSNSCRQKAYHERKNSKLDKLMKWAILQRFGLNFSMENH